jgi:hypothetical protein
MAYKFAVSGKWDKRVKKKKMEASSKAT